MQDRKWRRGAVVVLLAIMIVSLYSVMAIAVDFSRLWTLRNELQTSADAAAHAGVVQLLPPHNPSNAITAAHAISNANKVFQDTARVDTLELGQWNDVTRTFTSVASGAVIIDAVHVVVSRQSTGLFMSAIGAIAPRIKARAVGWTSGGASPNFTRFLVDNEMFDPGMQTLKDIAQSLGTTSDALLTDGDGDWFVDIPPGIKYEAPTGQVGDEGLFDITGGGFLFSQTSNPSFEDFLNFNEDGSWRQDLVPKFMLDPLMGIREVNNAALYPGFVKPGACQVSPLYKSDISNLNSPPNSANGLGERRGLVAFSVDSIGSDPDGPSGSKLPNLWITICDPAQVLGVGLSQVAVGPGSIIRPILVK